MIASRNSDWEQEFSSSTSKNSISIDAASVPNAVLSRLIEEVRNDSANNLLAYNRTHNRHNRGR
jgi:hypothetical protein